MTTGPPTTPQSDPLVREVWESVKHSAVTRASALQAAIRAYADTGDQQHRQQALEEAHRLAGALGSFGYVELSASAARVEKALEAPGPGAAQVAQAAADSARLLDGVTTAVTGC